MLSATADHALRAVLFIARQPHGHVAPATEIANAIGAPRNYLSKTLYSLAKAGIVTSVPGRAGGFTLAIRADRLTLHHVISVFDETRASGQCLLGNRPCNPRRPCAAHQRWTAIDRANDAALRGTTVAEMIGE